MSEPWKSWRNWILSLSIPIGLFIWLLALGYLHDTYEANGQPLVLDVISMVVSIMPTLIVSVIFLIILWRPRNGGE